MKKRITDNTCPHPGDKVTIIRQDDDGDYLCELSMGVRIWMRPDQLKFD